jgi:hypothetical protein
MRRWWWISRISKMSERGHIKILGFAGHRAVPDPGGLRKCILAELTEMKALLGDRMTAISSAAAGADLIFLRACIELRIPAIVILPFPEERFAEDFDEADEWKLAQDLTGVSLARYVAPGGHGAPEAYHQVSRHLLEWADAFLFAWDGKEPRGAGGTGEAVLEARELGIPSRIIDEETLAARWDVDADASRKPRHGFDTRAELLDFLDARFG